MPLVLMTIMVSMVTMMPMVLMKLMMLMVLMLRMVLMMLMQIQTSKQSTGCLCPRQPGSERPHPALPTSKVVIIIITMYNLENSKSGEADDLSAAESVPGSVRYILKHSC